MTKLVKTATCATLVALAVLPTASQAGFADSLRSIRDTVNQITYTSSDVKTMSSEVGGFIGAGTSQKQVTTSTGTTLTSGQVMSTKINNVSLYQSADKTSAVLNKLPKGSELVFSGSVKNGLYLVTTEFGEGWVDANLVY